MEKNQSFEFKPLTEEEKEKRGILGRLYGPCASISIPTRNGRIYSKSLWEKVFSNDSNSIVNEMFKNGGIPMELDHPADRLETCSDRIAAMLPEPPQKDNEGHLVCYVDILDTPCGKIAYQLAKYGFNLGISSRGNGETFTDYDGNESVDPNTYDFQTFDLVLLPSVKDARLKLMTEGLGNKTFKQALNESLDRATPEDRKIMEEALKDLKIDYSDSEEESNNIEDEAAKDDGAELVKTLQESILAKEEAEAKVTELQEKLSVCYAKEAKYEEDISKYKNAIRNLSESASNVRVLQNKVKELTEELDNKNKLIQDKDNENSKLVESRKAETSRRIRLSENLSVRDSEIKEANQKISNLTEQLEKEEVEHKEEKQKLEESYQELRKDYKLKESQYSNKLEKANKLIEQYRNKAQAAVNRYIESKALVLGVTAQEIKNRLTENYNFDEIDRVCENLSNYSLQVNNLPFSLKSVKKVNLTESRNIPGSNGFIDDSDEVDEGLIRLANKLMN